MSAARFVWLHDNLPAGQLADQRHCRLVQVVVLVSCRSAGCTVLNLMLIALDGDPQLKTMLHANRGETKSAMGKFLGLANLYTFSVGHEWQGQGTWVYFCEVYQHLLVDA